MGGPIRQSSSRARRREWALPSLACNSVAEPGLKLIVSPETPHDWWNVGPEEAVVRLEMRPAARFEAMQLAVFARDFDDVMQLTEPPRIMQRILFGLLAPLARLLG